MQLKEPPDTSGALEVVRAFFNAVSREDMQALRTTLTPDASLQQVSGGSGGAADSYWERRLSKLDYLAVGPEPVYRESAVEVYGYKDLDQQLGDRPPRPPIMIAGDILVRVPIEIRRVGTDRLFGDDITFVVRRVSGRFKIRTMIEDFQMP